MKSSVNAAVALAIIAALVASVFAALGRPSAALLVLAVAVAAGSVGVAAAHRYQVRTTLVARAAAQRDTRAITSEVRQVHERVARSGATAAAGSQKIEALTAAVQRSAAEARSRSELMGVKLGNSFGEAGPYFGLGPTYEYAERARVQVGRFETFALRSKSHLARDVLFRSATNMQFTADDTQLFIRAMRAGYLPGAAAKVKTWHTPSLLAAARVLANQRTAPGDMEFAEGIYRLVEDLHGQKSLAKSDIYIYCEVLAALGHHTRAAKLFRSSGMRRRDPVHYDLMQANAAISGAQLDGEESERRWTEIFSAVLERDGRSGVTLNTGGGLGRFDGIGGTVAARTAEGPLVTVIVPTFNGSEFLATTLRCLVEQTWKNIEIIVVDDASDLSHQVRVREICEEFDDVTLVTLAENAGAYRARNRALELARGALVTVHDDDDWSHPEKIEVQARDLLARGPRAANMTRHVRTSQDLVMGRINNNPSFSQPNFSSLMFDRSLIEEIGPWDDVNRGADAEFRDRLVRAIGEPVETIGLAPLSLTRTHDASLTAGEIGRGYLDPSRLLYQAAYLRAHDSRDNSTGEPVPAFARPLNMEPGMRGKHLGTFDVVFGSDFRFPGGTSALTLNEIEHAARAGMRVGVLQLDSALNPYSHPFVTRLLDLALLPNVHILSLSDHADVSALVVRHPSVLQFADQLTSNLRVGSAAIIINNPPILLGGKGVVYSFDDVAANAARLFGIVPQLVPESGVTRRLCLRMAPAGLLSDRVWPGFIDTSRFTPRPDSTSDRVPVLGRHSRDNALKWPDKLSTIESLYASTADVEVRILGGARDLPEAAADLLRARSDVKDFGTQDVPDFLDGLDFWAYFHSDRLTESFGMATVEAMASGLPVFLPAYMRPTFGDGATYAEPHEVHGLIKEMWSDPELYRERSRAARAVAEQQFSATQFLARLDEMVESGASALGKTNPR